MFHLAALVHQIGDDRLCDPSRLRLDRGVLQRSGEVGPFETTVDLEPGSWTVAVFESSAMDGQPLNLVSATITVK